MYKNILKCAVYKYTTKRAIYVYKIEHTSCNYVIYL
jgi:hypothetical protein